LSLLTLIANSNTKCDNEEILKKIDSNFPVREKESDKEESVDEVVEVTF